MSDAMYGYSSADIGGGFNASLSTEGSTSYVQFLQSIHQHDQYPSGMNVDLSPNGMFSGNTVYGAGISKRIYGRYLINQIVPEGCRPRRYFKISGNVLSESTSSHALSYAIDSYDFSAKRVTGFTSNGSCSGAAGYNEKTKTLVVTHWANNTTVQITKFKSTVDLNSCARIQDFFDNATVTASSGTCTNDGTQIGDAVIVVGDNDYVAISYRRGGTLFGDLVSPTMVYTQNYYAVQAGTTSYGPDNDPACYTKMQLTWDSKWVAAFTSYYYYGCGLLAHIISVEDPQRYFTILNSTTSYGNALFAFGKSGFLLTGSANTDTAGVQLNHYDFSKTAKTGTAASIYSSSVGGANVSVANGAALVAGFNIVTSDLHGGYFSTCYPIFFSVNAWPQMPAHVR